MSEIVVETTPSETVIEIEGGPTLTTTVTQELQTLIEVPAEPVVIDLNSGARGEPGSAILTGPAYPTLLMGSVGDLFIITEGDVGIGDVYTKTNIGWVLSGNIRGATGGIESVNNQFGPVVVLDQTDVGLPFVDNTSDLDKPVSTATQTALDALEDTVVNDIGVQLDALSDEVDTKQDFIVAGEVTQYWRGDKSWQILDKAAAGLANVDNTSDANKPISTATQGALDLKAPLASPTFTGTVGGITKSMVGLANIDNTSDANKPVSTAQAAAIALKVALTGNETISGTKTFDGIIIVPTPTADFHASTKKYVDDAIFTLTNGSPALLNTLDELAAALGDDPNFATSVTNSIATKVSLTGAETIAGIKTFSSAPVVPDASWTIAKTSGLQAALDLKAPLASPTFTGTITGNGSGLTALPATSLTGTIDVARLPSTVVLTSGAQTIAGVKTFSSSPVVPDSSFTIAKTTGLQAALDAKQPNLGGQTAVSSGTDWNTLVANAVLAVYSVTGANGPTGAYGFGTLHVMTTTGNNVTQTYYPHQTSGAALVYTRTKFNASDWMPWKALYDGTLTVLRVVHNGTSWPARPTGATYVEWVGPTPPGSATANDTWVNTSV